MSDFINTIDALGDDVVIDSIIKRTITEIRDNVLTTLNRDAIRNCLELTIVDLPSVSGEIKNAFYNCFKLTSVNIPEAQELSYAFVRCESLVSVSFPKVTKASFAFQNCTGLKTVDFPLLTTIESECFSRCYSLPSVDFPLLTSIGSKAFGECTSLTAFLLRGSSVCALANTDAFRNTPIESGTGYIYVPAALVDSYKAATNWSTYAAQFRALEDYTVDGTTTGELDETKI